MVTQPALGIRWTVGNVHPCGFEALRLSVWGAWTIFGPETQYVICVNSIPVDQAQELTGEMPSVVTWRDVTDQVPEFLQAYFSPNMAEGVGWKLAPVRLFPNQHELALDNDCVLWEMPSAIRRWLEDDAATFMLAEDVRPMFGRFTALCGSEPRNSGIRGLPPGFDLADALEQMLSKHPGPLTSELDEQGLQVFTLQQAGQVHLVSVEEVSICSPFWPHYQNLGRCGAHFVGLNAWNLPWDYQGRPASELTREHWLQHRPTLDERLAAPAG